MAKELDPMQEKVSVLLPKVAGEDANQFVAVNGQSFLIPRGKRVEVPKAIALVLEESERMREQSDEYSEEEIRKINIVQGAPV